MTFLDAPWRLPRCVSSVLVSGPDVEPLTLEQGKLRAGLDWPAGDPRDELMLDWIAAARSQVERDTGLALLTQVRDVTYTTLYPGAVVPMPAQAMPVQSVEPLPAPAGRRPVVFPALAAREVWLLDDWPAETTGLRVTAGWPDVATLRKEAPLLLQAVGLLTAHYATLGRDLTTLDSPSVMPMGYEDAIASYRIVWVT